jgi:hypothetical protein
MGRARLPKMHLRVTLFSFNKAGALTDSPLPLWERLGEGLDRVCEPKGRSRFGVKLPSKESLRAGTRAAPHPTSPTRGEGSWNDHSRVTLFRFTPPRQTHRHTLATRVCFVNFARKTCVFRVHTCQLRLLSDTPPATRRYRHSVFRGVNFASARTPNNLHFAPANRAQKISQKNLQRPPAERQILFSPVP